MNLALFNVYSFVSRWYQVKGDASMEDGTAFILEIPLFNFYFYFLYVNKNFFKIRVQSQ